MKNFLIVYFAVIFANLTTLTVYEVFQQYKTLNNIGVETLEKVEVVEAEQTAQQQPVVNNTELKRQQEKLEKAKRLCNYWEKQYDKESSDLNAALRDKACLKYNKLEAAMPSAE